MTSSYADTPDYSDTSANPQPVTFLNHPKTGQAWTWNDINNLILWVNNTTTLSSNPIRLTELRAEISVTNAPALSFSPEAGYLTDGVNPDGGAPSESSSPTEFVYKIVYSHGANLPPDALNPKALIDGIEHPMLRDISDINQNNNYDDDFYEDPLRDGDFTNGEQYVYKSQLPAADSHKYLFKVDAGVQTVETSEKTGPNTSTATQIPTLKLSTEIGYQATVSTPQDGVDPNMGATGDT